MTLETPLSRLQAIGLTPQLLAALSSPLSEGDGHALLRVAEVHRDALVLHDGRAPLPARARPALIQALAAEADALAVGDWVLAEHNRFGECWVHERLPPRTQLARRLHDGRDKVERVVLASNVDTALLVMGLDHDFNLRRLERYLALVRLAGISCVVVLSKADLCADPARRLRDALALAPAGVEVLALNTLADDARALLAPWLAPGQTLVLLGSSGAGKSTLANALCAAEVAATSGTRRGDGRGRHTTTVRTLHPLPGGACLIDTPGLRTLRLDSEAGDVAGAFDDIAALAPMCRFRDCRHEGEPGCAVRGAVAPERLKSFGKLLREAQRDTMSALERRELVSTWKARQRAGRANLKAKRG
ncbi:ribosome small subunit-dependent GTPase A [Rubrivivax gelatinosus]|uniref:Small ribosomal subunit biogenesis GTPase RsgA n=1 Tax=Rubrivivax gelatinosus TaxID=28068 RepID=A0ABS1DVI3_RUBGE|nr:ribosome small subunit-dependent GTPase A [Rubrivivax gelatinosus]MBK1714036.1 ribosome small subunit-dependent GTPase A [Rubrivivax gelatinosus]